MPVWAVSNTVLGVGAIVAFIYILKRRCEFFSTVMIQIIIITSIVLAAVEFFVWKYDDPSATTITFNTVLIVQA